jgi:O-antigen ligase/Flp pilus assembly protein TadD
LLSVAFVPVLYDREARDPYTPLKEAALGTVLTGLVAVLAFRSAGRGIAWSWAVTLPAGIAVAGIGSAARAASGEVAADALSDVVFLAVPAAIAGCALLASPRRVLLFANAIGVAGFLVAVVGILQHQRLDWWGYRGSVALARGDGPAPSPDLLAIPVVGPLLTGLYGLLDRLSRPNVDLAWAGPAEDFLRGLLVSRPFARLPTNDGPASVFGHPNVAAEVVAAALVGLAVAAWAAWCRACARGRCALAVVPLALRLGALATMAFYVMATGTRGAWVAIASASGVLAVASVILAPRGRRLRRAILLLVLAASVAGAALLAASRIGVAGRGGGAAETPLDRLAGLFRPSPDPARDTILERRILWSNTSAMIGAHPRFEGLQGILGVGPGNWQVNYPLHHRSVMAHPVGTYTPHRYADHPHQDPLEFLAEFGLVGLVLLSAFVGSALAGLARRAAEPGETRHAALVLAAVVTALACTSLFSFPLHLPVGQVLLFLSLGAALAPGVPARPAGDAPATPAAAFPPARIAFSALAFSLVASLGGARAGAAVAAGAGILAAILAWRGRLAPRAVAVASIAAAAACAAAHPALRGALGLFDALVVPAALVLIAVAALPLDTPRTAGGAASRALAILAALAFVAAALGGAARVQASREHRTGIEYAWSARSIPGQREVAERRARDAFDRATVLDPAGFLAETARAGFLRWSGFFSDAEASALRVLRLHPWLVNARIELADVAMRQGRDERAMSEARKARGLNPDAVQPHHQLGILFLRQGRDALAAEEFERAVELSPGRHNPDARIRAAELYLMGGRDLARGLAHLGEAERQAADDPLVLSRVARLYSAPGAPPEFQAKAEALWKRVAALNPLDVNARMRVTVSPLLRGAPTRAELEAILATLDALILKDPDFDPANVRSFRALTLERLGRADEAVRAYREVMMLAGVAPFRTRRDDEELDAAIEAMRALAAEQGGATSRPPGADSGPAPAGGR